MVPDDLTEDPAHPKQPWPTAENCPECRADEDEDVEVFEANGVTWDVDEVAGYLKKVYGADHIVVNKNRTAEHVKGK